MEIFSWKIKQLNIRHGEGIVAMLNTQEASTYGISSQDKISLIRNGEEYVVDVSLSDELEPGTIWATQELLDNYPIAEWDNVLVSFTRNNPLSLQAIRKKLLGEKLNTAEIDAIVEDIQNNKLSDLILAYYTATSFFYKSDPEELAYTTKATAYTGDMYRFPGIVASKYSIWGVSGNETTMIIVPLLASLGISIPKTFSKSITSPAATGECVEVLMRSELKKQEIIRLVDKLGCCLAWNGNLNLAPANDRIIKVSAPLGMEPYARMISSIMAKNYAMGINHCLIDVPVGPTAKVTNQADAERVANHFKNIGEALGIKTEVAITKAEQPIGNGIGAILQVREVLRVLQQHPLKPLDLQEKALDLAAQIILLCNMAESYEQAYHKAKNELENGNARNKMQAIIAAQEGKNPQIWSEELELAPNTIDITAQNEGTLQHIDMKYLNMVARTLGAPGDASAGIYLHKKLWNQIQAGDLLYTLYAQSANKLKLATEMLADKDFFQISSPQDHTTQSNTQET